MCLGAASTSGFAFRGESLTAIGYWTVATGRYSDLSPDRAIVSTDIGPRGTGILSRRSQGQIVWRGSTADVPTSHFKEAQPVSLKGWIVVVEPDDLIRQLIERWLGEAGYGVLFAAKTHAVTAVVPSLVIADVSDPSCAGATIEDLRAAYRVPILALSARFRRGLGGSIATAHRLDVSHVLPKPFTRDELLVAVGTAVADR